MFDEKSLRDKLFPRWRCFPHDIYFQLSHSSAAINRLHSFFSPLTPMSSESNGDVRRRRSPSSEAESDAPPTAAEFKGTRGSLMNSIIAIVLWLGSVHLIVSIVLASFFFLPFPKSLGFVTIPAIVCVFSQFVPFWIKIESVAAFIAEELCCSSYLW